MFVCLFLLISHDVTAASGWQARCQNQNLVLLSKCGKLQVRTKMDQGTKTKVEGNYTPKPTKHQTEGGGRSCVLFVYSRTANPNFGELELL